VNGIAMDCVSTLQFIYVCPLSPQRLKEEEQIKEKKIVLYWK
jgi:hypothetical protein